jgi:hypothetical protein
MWPWEHLAFGYVLYSAVARLRGGPPGTREALAVAVGTQFPDLVDKPLAFRGVVETGLTPTHSLLVAVPLSVGVWLAAARRGAPAVGLAFAVGYGSHLVGDAVYHALLGGSVAAWFLLWPVVPTPPTPGMEPGLERVGLFVDRFLRFLGTPRGRLYILAEAGFLVGALAVWLRDGAPGVPGRRSSA